MVSFLLYNEDYRIEYEIEGNLEGNTLTFVDKSIENTLIFFEFHKKGIVMRRKGETKMNQVFMVNRHVNGEYFSNGVSLSIGAYTHSIDLDDASLTVVYDYYLNGYKQNRNTMKISW